MLNLFIVLYAVVRMIHIFIKDVDVIISMIIPIILKELGIN